MAMSSESVSVYLKVTLRCAVLHHSIRTGAGMVDQAITGPFFQLTCPTWCYLCSSCPQLNPGRFCGCVKEHMGIFTFEVRK